MFFALFVISVIGATWGAVPSDIPESALSVSLLAAEDGKAGTKYHVYGKANWFMAEEVCRSNGLKLIKISDQNKNDEVTYFIDKLTAVTGPYWTLANRLYDENTWSFSAVGDPVKYFNWAAGEPNNARGNEKCIEIYKNGQWNDQDCGDQRFVLCESNSK